MNEKRKLALIKKKYNDDNYQKNYCRILFHFIFFFPVTLLGHMYLKLW